jgi:CMP-N-acetylneuraminic acid synthetase
MTSRVVALVPLKQRSQRFPGKNLAILEDKPLYKWILESLGQVDEIEQIYIFSSSEIFEIPSEDKSGKIKFKVRPESLDGDLVSMNEVIRKFLKDIEAETIVLAHATSPFLSPKTITNCIRKVISGANDSALGVVKLHKFAMFNGETLNFDRTKDLPPLQSIEPIVIEQGGLYVFNRLDFLTENRRVGNNPHFEYLNSFEAVDIDTSEDFDIAKALLQNYRLN